MKIACFALREFISWNYIIVPKNCPKQGSLLTVKRFVPELNLYIGLFPVINFFQHF